MRRLVILTALLGLLCLAAPARSLPPEPGPPAPDPGPPAPETVITSGPEDGSVVESEAVFTFAATVAGAPREDATFSCSLDGAAATVCVSPVVYEELEEGAHVFSVAAEDPLVGSADPEPARRAFSVAETEGDDECEAGEEAEENADEPEEAEADEEDEGDEAELCEDDPESGLPPRECRLRTARASVSAAGERARLTLRYTTFEPTEARLSYRLTGAKGSLKLGEARRHLARRGVIRLAERLGRSAATRVQAARRFTVEVEVPGAPPKCRPYGVLKLSVKRASRSRLTWLQAR